MQCDDYVSILVTFFFFCKRLWQTYSMSATSQLFKTCNDILLDDQLFMRAHNAPCCTCEQSLCEKLPVFSQLVSYCSSYKYTNQQKHKIRIKRRYFIIHSKLYLIFVQSRHYDYNFVFHFHFILNKCIFFSFYFRFYSV